MEFNEYPKMSVATDIVIFAMEDLPNEDARKVPQKGMQVLLLKRDIEPCAGCWSLPGGFVDIDKDIYQAAKDKLLLKTGIDSLYMEQLYTYGAPGRDSRGRVVSVAHMALVKKSDIDAQNAQWFWVTPVRDNQYQVTDMYIQSMDGHYSSQNLAFDHKRIIMDAFNRVANKIEYTDVAFNLLPERFTVKELEMVYEGILGHKIPAFRRKIGDRIVSTNEIKDDGSAHRPAKYYTYNPNHTQKF